MFKARSNQSRWKKKTKESGIDIFQRRLLASEILGTLSENGFTRCPRLETKFGDNSEVVYAKPASENNRYIVAVYTSCNQVGGAFISRKKGKDAIRIAGLYIKKDGSTVGIIKNKRVNRTSESNEICKRMIQRITSSFLNIKEIINNNDYRCDSCGAQKFISKKGNLICSDICWSEK